ncbi:MAG TPA: chemotaxis protein CheW [Gemmatimonadales bacterium]|nr:chemotaxis protein CheW [Gemmatimonadales bacterium]
MSDGGVVRLLVFRVGELACAAPADLVREILPQFPATRIPGAPEVVRGLVNVRGNLITVIDGWRALGQPAAAGSTDAATTMLFELGVAPARRLVGFTVDEVVDLLAVGGDALEPRQALPGVDPTLVQAVGRRDGRLFIVLDTDALLGPVFAS